MSEVVGIGVDVVDVERIQKSIERYGKRFLSRVFTEEEQQYCDARARRFEHYAGRFAAKEAALKAMGTGINHRATLKDVTILPANGGPPEIVLNPDMAHELPNNGRQYHWLLSISHTPNVAVAQALLISS